jgi:hypothetical protein
MAKPSTGRTVEEFALDTNREANLEWAPDNFQDVKGANWAIDDHCNHGFFYSTATHAAAKCELCLKLCADTDVCRVQINIAVRADGQD